MRNNKNRQRRQRQLVEEALAAGVSVVVDNTNPTPEICVYHRHLRVLSALWKQAR